MRTFVFAVALVALADATPAAAFTCTVSPRGDTVIVKTDNPNAKPTSCTVTCRFKTRSGIATVNCTHEVPGGAKGWTVCLRATGGKAFTFEGGIESCKKPPA
jgi:hypothetical protein